MPLDLVDEAIDVGDPLVGLALVVEQHDLDLLAVDAALGVDRLELVLGHLPVLQAVLDDHAQGDADADGVLRGCRRDAGRGEQCRRHHVKRTGNAESECHEILLLDLTTLQFGSSGRVTLCGSPMSSQRRRILCADARSRAAT